MADDPVGCARGVSLGKDKHSIPLLFSFFLFKCNSLVYRYNRIFHKDVSRKVSCFERGNKILCVLW